MQISEILTILLNAKYLDIFQQNNRISAVTVVRKHGQPQTDENCCNQARFGEKRRDIYSSNKSISTHAQIEAQRKHWKKHKYCLEKKLINLCGPLLYAHRMRKENAYKV